MCLVSICIGVGIVAICMIVYLGEYIFSLFAVGDCSFSCILRSLSRLITAAGGDDTTEGRQKGSAHHFVQCCLTDVSGSASKWGEVL